ncbi:MAG: substrate-binding domain-containing protein [Opitutales bacterium]
MKSPRNVLLALGWYDHRLLQGIATYASEHRWHLASHSIIHEKVIPWGWDGDGILAWLGAGDDLADFVLKADKPTVDFSLRRRGTPFAHVVQDHTKTGELAAEHFIERGMGHFCFFSDTENWSQVERGQAFMETLRRRGLPCDHLRWTNPGKKAGTRDEWQRRRAWLMTRLKAAPKPLAVFAANGTLAVEVREICEEAGLHVPTQVAIVGIDDYLLSVGAIKKYVSGVDTNLEEQGYRGAELLDRLMGGQPAPPEPIRIQPAGVITRMSSDILATGHEGVVRALHHITDHFAGPLGVKELAAIAHMSERGLRQAFVKHVGCTPGDRLRTVRIDSAKRLLAGSSEKIESIAHRCGYPNLNSFFAAFRRSENMTPAEYRRIMRFRV